MRIHWITPMIALAVVGCPRQKPPDGCTPGDQVCRNDQPVVCSDSQRWIPVMRKCALMGAQCCRVPSYYDRNRLVSTCVRPETCAAQDGGSP